MFWISLVKKAICITCSLNAIRYSNMSAIYKLQEILRISSVGVFLNNLTE
jgi:hypothetical protein